MDHFLSLRGVRVHNLRGIDVDIPLGGITAVTGVSGAGKSSLVFDTLHVEAQRRYLQSFSTAIRQHLERLDRPEADSIGDLPPAIAVGHEPDSPSTFSTVGSLTELADYLRLLWARAGTQHCPRCGQPVHARGPGDVLAAIASFPQGTRITLGFPSAPEPGTKAAAWLAGLREEGFVRVRIGDDVYRLDQPELLKDAVGKLSLAGGDGYAPTEGSQAVVLVDRLETGKAAPERLRESVELTFSRGRGQLLLAWEKQDQLFETRLRCARCAILLAPLEPALFDPFHPAGSCLACRGTGRNESPCPECHAAGLNQQALHVHLGDLSFRQALYLPLQELRSLLAWADAALTAESRVLAQEALARLDCLLRLRLGYLTLHRSAPTLSSGELKRIRLASALASNLVQALYLFEEPRAGLHPRDLKGLAGELHRLRDAGNTVVLIEHDAELIKAADQVIDLGPGAGEEGGLVVYQGTPAGLPDCESSVTGKYLSGAQTNGVPSARRPARHGAITLRGANTHNLKNLTVDFPLNLLCVVAGVSGAGKSSLVRHTLHPALCKAKKKKLPSDEAARYQDIQGAGLIGDVVLIDQEPLPRTTRGNPATYLKILDEIRDLFAATTDAKVRNLGPGAFSFNQPGGRCEACAGQGVQTVDMQFLADVVLTCPECHGTRYGPEVLKVKVRGRHIAEVLDLTVREAFRFFRAQPAIEKRLKFLLDVGLDYLRLGQATRTLSGGEAQRLKLAGQMAAGKKSHTLFLLLEPTAGLHPQDVGRLLDCLDHLLETGHSLIVVEHHRDVLANADYLIELGPEGGPAGGMVVASGTPEEVAKVKGSPTGKVLREMGVRK